MHLVGEHGSHDAVQICGLAQMKCAHLIQISSAEHGVDLFKGSLIEVAVHGAFGELNSPSPQPLLQPVMLIPLAVILLTDSDQVPVRDWR